MFGFKKRKLKELRKKDYAILTNKFKDKHQIVCNWYMNKYLNNHNGLQPVTQEGFDYQKRVLGFFRDLYGKLPQSFNLFANVSYGDENFDSTPIEKLQDLYNQIEIIFPEPFVNTENKKL